MKYEYKPQEAMQHFNALHDGIFQIINAADLYAVHIIAHYKNMDIDKELVNRMIAQNKTSGFVFIEWFYDDVVMERLERSGQLKYIGNQILSSTYTAIEIYFIEKFREYYKKKYNDKSYKDISFRNIKEIRKNYWEYFDIHLPSFHIPMENFYTSRFQPKDSWEGITLIAEARDQIAHNWEVSKYRITTLVDSWYPFDFIRRWVDLFDVNFDFLIYGDIETVLIEQYHERVKHIK